MSSDSFCLSFLLSQGFFECAFPVPNILIWELASRSLQTCGQGCLEAPMPMTEDAAAECVSSKATLCDNCSKALQKPLVCARCKTATYCSKDCQVHTENGAALKAVICYSNSHTNMNVTE